jgi:hypothetical protein
LGTRGIPLVTEDLEKYERIKQLERLGQNVPLLMRIPCGTKFDKKLERELLQFAGDRRLMTVRTYAPFEEKLRGGGPFFPEIPVRKAIARVRELLPHYHVLFQEAIDVKKTKMVGRTLFNPSGRNTHEVLRGRVRVRDIDNPPPRKRLEVQFFSTPEDVKDPEIRAVTERINRIPLALGEAMPVIAEWNLQLPSDPVGVRHDPLIVWEWRPGT